MKTQAFTFLAAALITLISFAFTPAITLELVKVDKMEHDFGQIAQGEPQTAVFTLTNQSQDPMIITRVKGSCGCTATAYEKEPIAPGTSTTIEATYNAKNLGQFTKTVTVQTNLSENPIILTIKGKVQAS